MSGEQSLAGVLPVIQTPYMATGEIDVDDLDRELEWVLDQGADGLTTGMVSEVLRLSVEERRTLTERVCAAAGKRSRFAVISCGGETQREVTEHVLHAVGCGATALMAIPPISIALDEDNLYRYFAEILGASDLPLVVQDASGYVGKPLGIDVQAKLSNEFGDQVYFKPEAPPIGQRLSELREATGGRSRAFEGSGGAAIVDSFRRGIVGTMPGAEVCWVIRRLWDAAMNGDWDLAYEISGPLMLLVSMQTTVDGYVAIEKHLLKRQGVIRETFQRAPSGYVLDPETAAEADRLFDRLVEATE